MPNPLSNLNNPNTVTADGETVDATEWTTDWSTLVNFINASLVASFNVFAHKGDIMCYDGTSIQALPVGTDGQILFANSTQPYGLQWATPVTTGALTTQGDTLYYNAGLQRLPIGTTNQVLAVSSGGIPYWENLSGTLPVGAIVMWSGAINTIPLHWALCDGVSNASGINLQGLFVVGAGGTSPAATGGMGLMNPGGPHGDTSAGAGLGPSHTHSAQSNPINFGSGGGYCVANILSTTVTPRYYALCFIELQP